MPMKTVGYDHQNEGFERSRDLEYFGVWWEMGLGKSKLVIDTSCHLFLRERIQGLLVVAPNGVHGNFLREMPVHCWDDVAWEGYVYDSSSAGLKREKTKIASLMEKDPNRLAVLVMSYDGIKTAGGFEVAQSFLTQYPSVMVLDESTAIAEPMSQRNKRCQTLGKLARYRRVMSGTPVAEGPFKIYTQMRFLNDDFWKSEGLNSYFSFKNMFARFERCTARQGHAYQKLIGYQNLDYLHRIISDVSSRVLKEDALDLPPKIYTRVEFEMDKKQAELYAQLKKQIITEIDEDHQVEMTLALVRLTRLQQLTSGFVVADEKARISPGDICMWRGPEYSIQGEVVDVVEVLQNPESEDMREPLIWKQSTNGQWSATVALVSGQRVGASGGEGPQDTWRINIEDPRLVSLTQTAQHTVDIFAPEDNPRLKALQSVLDQVSHKVIIWARFRRDVDMICDLLGKQAVRYDGLVNTRDRVVALDRFREDNSVRYFVANQQAISMGVTLTVAKTVVYYSNLFALEKRLQSEDRAHRIGQTDSVNIVDLCARGTVDEYIVETLLKKYDLAASVMGDAFREWLR